MAGLFNGVVNEDPLYVDTSEKFAKRAEKARDEAVAAQQSAASSASSSKVNSEVTKTHVDTTKNYLEEVKTLRQEVANDKTAIASDRAFVENVSKDVLEFKGELEASKVEVRDMVEEAHTIHQGTTSDAADAKRFRDEAEGHKNNAWNYAAAAERSEQGARASADKSKVYEEQAGIYASRAQDSEVSATASALKSEQLITEANAVLVDTKTTQDRVEGFQGEVLAAKDAAAASATDAETQKIRASVYAEQATASKDQAGVYEAGSEEYYNLVKDLYTDMKEGIVYRGTWNPKTGAYPNPLETNSAWDVITGTSEGVEFDGDTWYAGDKVIYSKEEKKYYHLNAASAVQSVCGKTGAVTLTAEDVGALGKVGNQALNGKFEASQIITTEDNALITKASANHGLALYGSTGRTILSGGGRGGFVAFRPWGITSTTGQVIVRDTGNVEASAAPTIDAHLTNKAYVDTKLNNSGDVTLDGTLKADAFHVRGNAALNFNGDSAYTWRMGSEPSNGTMVINRYQNHMWQETPFMIEGHSGNIHLANKLFVQGHEAYHPNNKPTAADVGALSKNSPVTDGPLKIETSQHGFMQIQSPLDSGQYFSAMIGDSRSWWFGKGASNSHDVSLSSDYLNTGVTIKEDGVHSNKEFFAAGKKVYHEGNLPRIQDMEGFGEIDRMNIKDIRGTTPTPRSFAEKAITTWFNDTDIPSGQSWHSGITVKGWDSAMRSWQISSNSTVGEQDDALYFRSGNEDTWGEFQKVYTDKHKPTLEDIGAIGSTGTQTINGGLNLSGNGKQFEMGTNSYSTFFGNSKNGMYFYIHDNGMLQYDADKIYHTGFKPTAADVGAVSSTSIVATDNGMVFMV